MTIWARIALAVVGLLKPLMALLVYIHGKKVGREESDNAKLATEQERILAAKKAKEEADADNIPDPYLRD